MKCEMCAWRHPQQQQAGHFRTMSGRTCNCHLPSHICNPPRGSRRDPWFEQGRLQSVVPLAAPARCWPALLLAAAGARPPAPCWSCQQLTWCWCWCFYCCRCRWQSRPTALRAPRLHQRWPRNRSHTSAADPASAGGAAYDIVPALPLVCARRKRPRLLACTCNSPARGKDGTAASELRLGTRHAQLIGTLWSNDGKPTPPPYAPSNSDISSHCRSSDK